MPVYVCILQSESTGRCYIGHTRGMQERLVPHNEGRAGYTRTGRPWRLVYCEEHESRSAAMKRESELKGKHRRGALEALVRSRRQGSG